MMEKNQEFAIIKTGGKQYKVRCGEELRIEKLAAKEGKVVFEDMLFGKKVAATILSEGQAAKVRVLKFRAKKRYKRIRGHRQKYSLIRIEEIK